MRNVLCAVLFLVAGQAYAQPYAQGYQPPMVPVPPMGQPPVVNQQIVQNPGPSGPPNPIVPPNIEGFQRGWEESWKHVYRPYREWEDRPDYYRPNYYPPQYYQPGYYQQPQYYQPYTQPTVNQQFYYNPTTGCNQRDLYCPQYYQPYTQPCYYYQPQSCWRSWFCW
jgi:hypothetical protein